MADIILHHYPESLFSERVRLAMGLKGLRYRSVRIPIAMPKPDLLPLTGGYRRTPVMQIGADVYCDTLLILQTLEALHPVPSLYPGNSEGTAKAIAWWADKSILPPAMGVFAAEAGHTLPPDFVTERKAFGFPLEREEAVAILHRHLQQGSAHLGWMAEMLRDGRPFLLGNDVSAADLAAYCPLWLVKTRLGARAADLLPVAPLDPWYARVTALGHGTPVEMTAEEALAIARDTEPADVAGTGGNDPSGLSPGTEVAVTPDDTGRDPVRGELIRADRQVLVIRSEHPRTGKLNIHFPRAGFDVVAA